MPEMTEEQRKQLEEKIKNMSPEELKEFQKQQCIFCQIISGKVPSKKVYEDDKCIAILDIYPAVKGHLLLIPKEHYAIMPQIPDKEIGHLLLVSRYLSQVMLKIMKAGGTSIFVANGPAAGQKAQHFMIHVIPRKEDDKIMDVPEKIIDAALRAKVVGLVRPKLDALLGVKKETQKKLDAEPAKEAPQPTAPPEEESVPEPEESLNRPKSKSKKSSPKKSSKKKASSDDEEDEDSPQPKSGGDVSLDDIANLFK